MAQQQRVDILLPVGRIVMGDLYKSRDKDAEGKPLVIKEGPDKGKPRVDYFFAVAIPKEPGHTAWWQTAWGQQIMQAGANAFPQVYQTPSFAWKIDDGDSQIPNKRGRKPADSEGFPGHWIVKLSSGFAPKIYTQPSAGVFNEITGQPGVVKTGYWVQVRINPTGNGSVSQPGVHLNHAGVLFVRPDKEIVSGPDAATMFGGAAVSAALPGVAAMPAFAAAPGAAPAMPAPMGTPAAMMYPTAAAAPAMPAPTAVAPNPAFLGAGMPAATALAVPMAAPVPMAPAAVPAPMPVGPTLTPQGVASGFTYEQYRQSGWTDEQLRGNGLIV